MSDNVSSGGIVSVQSSTPQGQSLTVQSNTAGSASELNERLSIDKTEEKTEKKAKPDISEAASEMGRKGGEAAAKKRAEAAKEAKKAEKESESEEEADAKPASPKRAAEPREADSGDADRDAGEDDGEHRDPHKGNPRHDPRARVEQVTRQHAETKRALAEERQRREDLERRVNDYERRSAPASEGQQRESRDQEGKAPEPPGKPKVEDFTDYEEYLNARDDWRDQRREAEQMARRAHHEHSTRIHGHLKGFADSMNKALSEDPELDGRIGDEVRSLRPTLTLPDGHPPPTGHNFIADELIFAPDDAPRMAAYLTEHPDEFQRIASLRTPREVTRAMAKISVDAVTAGTGTQEPAVSKAPRPIKPVSGEPYVGDGVVYKGENQSLEDYAARWNKHVKPRLRR